MSAWIGATLTVVSAGIAYYQKSQKDSLGLKDFLIAELIWTAGLFIWFFAFISNLISFELSGILWPTVVLLIASGAIMVIIMQEVFKKAQENPEAVAQVAEVAGAAAGAYDKHKKQKQLKKQQQQVAEQSQKLQEQHAKVKQKKQELEQSKVTVPKNCPFCGTSWRNSGGVLSGKNYEELRPNTFQCKNCDHTKDFN